jgi:hypothetical protein
MKNSSIAAARQIATELGRSPSHAGTSRLASDLERTSTVTTKHTPGPWKVCYHLECIENDRSCPCGQRGTIWGGDGNHVVCQIGVDVAPGDEAGSEPPRYPREVEIANAHLISAAPELLAKLARLVKAIDSPIGGEVDDVVGMLEYGTATDEARALLASLESAQ